MVIKRFEVWRVNLNPIVGSEIDKVRPFVVISPDQVNKYLRTITVAALTHTKKDYPTRVDCYFDNQHGQVCLDQIRSVDKTRTRFIEKMGELDDSTSQQVCETLQELFVY